MLDNIRSCCPGGNGWYSLLPAHGRVRPVEWSRHADSPAGEWHAFEGTWTTAGTRRTLRLAGAPRGHLRTDRVGAAHRGAAAGGRVQAQAIGFSDSRAGMQGRCVWTDERGDRVYSELKGEAVGSGNYIGARSLAGQAVMPA